MKTQLSNSLRLLAGTLVLFGSLFVKTNVDAQCFQNQQLTQPMWEVYGINPFHPRTVAPVRYTPLQPVYQAQPQFGVATEIVGGEIYLGEIESNELITETFSGDRRLPMDVTGNVVQPDFESVDEPGSISSPSDIALAPESPEAPTLANASVTEAGSTPAIEIDSASAARLAAAEAEMEQLKQQLEVVVEKARSASERAYAAERAAKASAENAKRKLRLLETDLAKQLETKSQSEIDKRDVEIAALTKQLDAKSKATDLAILRRVEEEENLRIKLDEMTQLNATLEARLNERQRRPSAENPAQKQVDRLVAQAKQAADDDKLELAGPDKSKPANDDKKPGKFNANEQIKKLNASMERQLKKSGQKINSLAQIKIKQLIKNGTTENSDEVKAIRKEMEADLKANETKIRTRIEERIQRIRKEQAARQRS